MADAVFIWSFILYSSAFVAFSAFSFILPLSAFSVFFVR